MTPPESPSPRDLPDAPSNVTAFIYGYYTGFLAFRVYGGGDVTSGKDAWYYFGYVLGWFSKAFLIVWLAQEAIPPVDTLVRPAAEVITVSGLTAVMVAKLKLVGLV